MNPHERQAGKRVGSLRTTLAAVTCSLRGLPLLFRASPRTPLRVLCIIALDTLHVLRTSRRLPRPRIRELAAFLDFQACANAVLDHKRTRQTELEALRQQLNEAGFGLPADEYLRRLRILECRRPAVGGDHRHFDEVRSYREAVARLSLATIAAVAFDVEHVDAETHATHFDGDLQTLLAIVMQCQIIDDVLDYPVDARVGLPSFLTATSPLPLSLELTAKAARVYASNQRRSPDPGAFPFRAALRVITALTRLVVRIAHWRAARDQPALDSVDSNRAGSVAGAKGA